MVQFPTMNYHPSDFQRLAEEVEEQGGTALPGAHNPRKLSMKLPDAEGESRWQDAFTTGCHQEARFLVPYALPGGKLGEVMEQRGAGIVEVCAVDDDMGKWPRFVNAIQEDSM